MIEIWKDIPGYEGKYQVSNTGEVKSLNYNGTGKAKLLKQLDNRYGYLRVTLFKNGKRKWFRVHRLVAMTFLPNPNNYREVNHKDENKYNNNVDNLEWCNAKYNMNYGTRNERASKSHKGKCKGKYNGKSKPVLMYDENGNLIKRFECVAEASRYFGTNCGWNKAITDCLKGKQPTAYNYIFKYENEENN